MKGILAPSVCGHTSPIPYPTSKARREPFKDLKSYALPTSK